MIISDREANEAEKYGKDKRINTVIIINKISLYTSDLVITKLKQCPDKVFYLFFISTHSLEVNIIEGELHQSSSNFWRIFKVKNNLAKVIK